MGFAAFVERNRRSLLFLSLFLVLFGARAVLIRYAGYPTPFLDEWEADGAAVLKPYLAGALGIGDLLRPLNEHRIVFTKLLVLAIFAISGYWDVVVQMIVNTVVDAATVVAIAWALSRVLNGCWALAAMILSTAINALPYGYDNAVLGFNTHFYLLLTLSFASLWFLTDSRAFSLRWAAGVLFALASSLCLASGALTLAAAGGAQLLQTACGRRSGLREALGIAALMATAVVQVSLVPHVPEADPFRAHSVEQAFSAFVQLASWPSHTVFGLIFFVPTAVSLVRTLKDRPALSDPRWFNVMALAWVASQLAALSVGRALLPLQTRYSDILLIGLTINLVSAFWLFERNAAQAWPALRRRLALAIWLGFLAASLTHPQRHIPDKIEEWRTILASGQRNVRDYLATGDPSFVDRAPAVEVPSFDPRRLRELLDTPEIRAALPPDLTGKPPPRPWVETIKGAILRLGFVWLGAGLLLLFAVPATRAFAPTRLRRVEASEFP